jgi:ATP-binding cassette subfamily F protein 3
VISHDRDLLNNAVDSIVHLFDRKLTFWRGGYDSFERQYREQQILQGKARVKQEAERKHMEAFVERFRAKASKARQAQSRLKALAKLQPIAEVNRESVLPFKFPDPERKAAPPIIRLENISVGYQPGKPVLSGLNLRIDEDDRIALLGTNGNGKSTFAKLVAGALQGEAGHITRAPKLKIGLFAQHQLESLNPEESAFQHIRTLMPGAAEAQVRSRVARMGLATEKMQTPAKDLSGGEKARLMMGIAAFGAPHLLILDEPTNHLDIDSREALVHALNDYEGAVILISHDRHLIEACADRLWLVADRTVKPFEGDIEDYRKMVLGRTEGPGGGKQKKSASPKAEAQKPEGAKQVRRITAEQREAMGPLRKKIKDAERTIEKFRAELKTLDARLADPDLYKDAARAAALAKERADRTHDFARAESEWLDLSEELEALEGGHASAA